METLCPINMTDDIPMSAASSDSNSDVLSHDEAESSADDVINTPSATGSSSVTRRLFTASEENGPNAAKDNAVGYLTNQSTTTSEDTQLLILQEMKKANSRLSAFSDRLEAVESRLASVENNQLSATPASTSADSSADSRKKRKVPAKVRVSLFISLLCC